MYFLARNNLSKEKYFKNHLLNSTRFVASLKCAFLFYLKTIFGNSLSMKFSLKQIKSEFERKMIN